MAKQTIIDWQRDGLLVLEGHGHGVSVAIDGLSWQPIAPAGEAVPDDPAAAKARNGDAAQALGRAVEGLGLRKRDVTIVASRDVVEMRTLSIPRMDSNELPDVIRFQAQRQLANMGDHWTLDYVLLPERPGQEMLTALVGVLPPAVQHEMEAACTQAGVQLAHIALRPIEIARFASASGNLNDHDVAMVICLSEQDADLLLLQRGGVAQVRGTRLPHDRQAMATALMGELRRSLMAASNQLAGQAVGAALLVASPELAALVQPQIAQLLGCSVTLVDPGQLLSGKAASSFGPRAGEFANRLSGAAGAIHFAAADRKTKLDFKDPKKRPPPKSRRTTYLLAGAAAALLALGGFYWWSSMNRELDEELASYRDRIAAQKDLKEAAEARIAELAEVEKFMAASPNWLDELTYLAEQIPGAEKVILGDTSFSVLADGTGRISMPIAVDSAETIDVFETALRDEHHVVASKNSVQLDAGSNDLYRWRADETVSVRGRGWSLSEALDSGNPAPAAKVTQN